MPGEDLRIETEADYRALTPDERAEIDAIGEGGEEARIMNQALSILWESNS